MSFIDTIESMTPSEIRRVQGELLRRTVDYCRSRSPFYRKRLKGMGAISSIDDIASIPLTSKADIQEENSAFLCVPMTEVAEVVATTGTTGTHVYNWLTTGDLARLAENERRAFARAGVTPSDIFLLAVTLDNLFIAGMAYYSGLRKLGAGVVRLGPHSPRKHLEVIQALRPTGIVAVPSFISAVYRQADKDDIDINSLGIRKAVLIGETIRNADFTSNELGNIVERLDGLETYSTYGITEISAAFCECPSRSGLHGHSDLVYAEIIDEDGHIAPDGEAGELVVTTFGVEGTPLIRYRTGDVTFKVKGACECGASSVRLGPVIGRKAHKLKVKGATIYPRAIENALVGINGVENYVIEAYTGDDHSDALIVRVGSHNMKSAFKLDICDAIRAKARVTPQVEVMPPQEVDKILFEGGGRKPMLFIDRRRKANDVKL
ncbi:MAG: AMP-binding protein [Deltaproteobacteria bacterium]|nr:AMP-binding protein [Deltaproteobacteria bacterium]